MPDRPIDTELSENEWDAIYRETKDEYLKLVVEADNLLSECHRRSFKHDKARRKLAFKELSGEVASA